MGMYDEINLKVECPECESVIDGFQSKDGPCLLMIPLDYWEVKETYSQCSKCELYIRFNHYGNSNKKLLSNWCCTTRKYPKNIKEIKDES